MDEMGPKLAEVGSIWAKRAPEWPGIGQTWANFGSSSTRDRPNLDRLQPNSAQICPQSTTAGLKSASLARFRLHFGPNSNQSWSGNDQTWLDVDNLLPDFGQLWPKRANFDQKLAGIRSTLCQLRQNWGYWGTRRRVVGGYVWANSCGTTFKHVPSHSMYVRPKHRGPHDDRDRALRGARPVHSRSPRRVASGFSAWSVAQELSSLMAIHCRTHRISFDLRS